MNANVKPTAKDAKPEAKADVTATAQPGVKPGVKPDAKPDATAATEATTTGAAAGARTPPAPTPQPARRMPPGEKRPRPMTVVLGFGGAILFLVLVGGFQLARRFNDVAHGARNLGETQQKRAVLLRDLATDQNDPHARPAAKADQAVRAEQAPPVDQADQADQPDQPSNAAPAAATPAPADQASDLFTGPFGQDDRVLLEQLRTGEVVRIKKGSGGRSIAFKVELDNGLSAYWKPEQSASSAHDYAEVAAFYLDRALGLGRVPATVFRTLAWAPFARAAEGDRRLAEVKVSPEGRVRGALIYWLPQKLAPAKTPPGFENWLRAPSERWPRYSPSPYQRAAVYARALAEQKARTQRGEPGVPYYESTPEPSSDALPAALSDMIIFDFLTLNFDRWGGDNANVLTLETDQDLIFLDNGDGFSLGPPRRSLIDARLLPLQRFRKRTLAALEKFSVEGFAAELAKDPEGSPLSPAMLEGLEQRRKAVLDHAAAQAERLGHDVVYAW